MFFLTFALLSLSANSYETDDPEFEFQFNVNNADGVYGSTKDDDINVKPVWNDNVFGDNVNFGIIGKGCNMNHIDLNTTRYLEQYSYNFDYDNDEIEVYDKDYQRAKTTGFLGIVAAEKNNGQGIHGVSPNVNYYCIKQTYLLDNDKIAKSLSHSNENTDVKLLTMPRTCENMHNSFFASCDGPIPHKGIEQAIESNPKTIIVSPVGDDAISGIDSNFFPEVKHPDVISVADTTVRGERSYWSTRGTCIVCNAPAGGNFGIYGKDSKLPILPTITTDHDSDVINMDTETDGYDSVGAGSASVAGVVSLMKQVNKELLPRDVRAIIASTSSVNDPIHESWVQNKGGYWYSDVYGFGKINAEECVKKAKQWKTLPTLKSATFKYPDTQLYTTRGGIATVTGSLTGDVSKLDFIDYAVLEFEYFNVGNLRISVQSEQGTTANVVTPSNVEDTNETVQYTIRNFYGESYQKTKPFTLNISRDGYGNQTFIRNIKLTIYGYEQVPDSLSSKSSQKMMENIRKPIPSTEDIVLKINEEPYLDEVRCERPITVTLECTSSSGQYANDIFELYLYDEEYSTFFQLDDALQIGGTSTVSIPCLLKNKTLILYAQNRQKQLSAQKKITLINYEIERGSLVQPAPYTIYFRNETVSKITIPLDYTYNLEYLSSDASAQALLIGVFDLDTKTDIYSIPMLISASTKIEFTVDRDYPHAVLYVMPQWHTKFDGCTTVIQPIQILSRDTVVNRFFNVPLATSCPVPPGIMSSVEKSLDDETLIDSVFDMTKWIYVAIFIIVILAIAVGYFIYKLCRKNNAKAKVDDSELGNYQAQTDNLEI